MSSDPIELRQRLADDLRAAMAAAQPTAEELARRSHRGPPIQGIKAAELAVRLGVGYDALLDWLRGDTEPSRENRLKLCGFLGITEDVYVHRYHLGAVSPVQPAPAPNHLGLEGRVAELEAEVAELRQMMKHRQAPLEGRGETA